MRAFLFVGLGASPGEVHTRQMTTSETRDGWGRFLAELDNEPVGVYRKGELVGVALSIAAYDELVRRSSLGAAPLAAHKDRP